MKIAAGKHFYEQFGQLAEAICPGLRWLLFAPDGSWSSPPKDSDIAVLIDDAYCQPFKKAILDATGLRWVHSENTGVDGDFYQQLIGKGIMLTRSPGANAPEVAEFVFAHILATVKRIADFQGNFSRKEWTRLPLDGLSGKTILVVGLGSIGSRVAMIAKAFGMHVLGIRKSDRKNPHADETGFIENLGAYVTRADIIVLALPLNAETTNLIGSEMFEAMKDNALLINVARGEIVDIAALKNNALKKKEFRVVLDVLPVEPWPADDDLWGLPNVLITPHIAWSSPFYRPRAAKMWLDNLERFIQGKPLEHLVLSV